MPIVCVVIYSLTLIPFASAESILLISVLQILIYLKKIWKQFSRQERKSAWARQSSKTSLPILIRRIVHPSVPNINISAIPKWFPGLKKKWRAQKILLIILSNRKKEFCRS